MASRDVYSCSSSVDTPAPSAEKQEGPAGMQQSLAPPHPPRPSGPGLQYVALQGRLRSEAQMKAMGYSGTFGANAATLSNEYFKVRPSHQCQAAGACVWELLGGGLGGAWAQQCGVLCMAVGTIQATRVPGRCSRR
jgi:hypothetical protein